VSHLAVAVAGVAHHEVVGSARVRGRVAAADRVAHPVAGRALLPRQIHADDLGEALLLVLDRPLELLRDLVGAVRRGGFGRRLLLLFLLRLFLLSGSARRRDAARPALRLVGVSVISQPLDRRFEGLRPDQVAVPDVPSPWPGRDC
jgi:hypothetical protein